MARVGVVSFRLGGTDGVSIEAQKWIGALRHLGHDVTTVAGAGTADIIVAGLAADAPFAPSAHELHGALAPFDLVVVENLASLPLNPAARDVLYQTLTGRPALFHHHDLPWQRAHLAHLEGPRDEPLWHHVTINELSRLELHARGIEATTIYNTFDCSPPSGRRDRARRALGVGNERLVVLPTRAIARKNIPGALRLCERLEATLWLMGPAEDGYDQELRRLLDASPAAVIQGVPDDLTMADAYAGADLVVMASSWEGFGNPVLESVTHRRPLALNPYPVAQEIISYGFRFFTLEDTAALESFLDRPDENLYQTNLEVARLHFNLTDLPTRLEAVVNQRRARRAD